MKQTLQCSSAASGTTAPTNQNNNTSYLSVFASVCVSVCVCACIRQMTLRRLLDHLKLVASYQEVNKMTCQNLAVCFGPVLLSQRQEASCHTNRVFIDSEELASALHFKKHIEVLHYLLQLWPGEGSFHVSLFELANKCYL